MVEKILNHHIRFVCGIKGDVSDWKNIRPNIARHAEEHLHPEMYPFSEERPLDKFIDAVEMATIALALEAFERVPDYYSASRGIRNFDLLCFNCPNYSSEEEICRLDPFLERFQRNQEKLSEDKNKIA